MSAPTDLEQYMLELINAVRRKADAQPLAFDGDLNEAADAHSAWMIATDSFAHTGSGGSSPSQRMTRAGYDFSGSWASAENIAWASLRGAPGLQDEVQFLHASLMNSPGHRTNLLNDTYREIGIGFQTGQYESWDSAFVTQNFALTRSQPFLTGVAFEDRDGDRLYDPGEGTGGGVVSAVSSTGTRYSTQTTTSGGYGMEVPAGTYTVTFSGGSPRQVTVQTDNVKVDLVKGSAATIGSAGDNTLYGSSAADTIKGLGGDDRLFGMASADREFGGAGKDLLSGGAGSDFLFGERGRDVLVGDSGNDVLAGGLDADIFRFRGSWGSDRITDFENGVDRIDLRTTGLSFGRLSISQQDVDRDGLVDDVMIRAGGESIALINEKVSAIGVPDFLF